MLQFYCFEVEGAARRGQSYEEMLLVCIRIVNVSNTYM
jgi:hypothetical protein